MCWSELLSPSHDCPNITLKGVEAWTDGALRQALLAARARHRTTHGPFIEVRCLPGCGARGVWTWETASRGLGAAIVAQGMGVRSELQMCEKFSTTTSSAARSFSRPL